MIGKGRDRHGSVPREKKEGRARNILIYKEKNGNRDTQRGDKSSSTIQGEGIPLSLGGKELQSLKKTKPVPFLLLQCTGKQKRGGGGGKKQSQRKGGGQSPMGKKK